MTTFTDSSLDRSRRVASGFGFPFALISVSLIHRPGIAAYNSTVEILLASLLVALFAYLLLKCHQRGTKIGIIFWLTFALRISTFLQTLISSREGLLSWLSDSASLLTLALLVSIYSQEGRTRELIRAITYVLIAYSAINTLTVLLWSTGEVRESTVFFLGIRTSITATVLCSLVLSLLLSALDRKIVTGRDLVALLLASFSFLALDVSTGLVALAPIMLFYIARILGAKHLFFSPTLIAVFAILLNLAVILLRVQDRFGFLIQDILGRDLSLTGRTRIWDIAIEKISQRPITGHGQAPFGGSFVEMNGVLWPAHSALLQVTYEGGLLALLVLFIIIIYATHSVSKSSINQIYKNVYAISLGTLLVISTTGSAIISIPAMTLLLIGIASKEVNNPEILDSHSGV